MGTVKQLAGQTAIYGLSSILGRLLNYLLVPLHTEYFAPSEYGIVSEFYAYVAFFVVLLMFGMETTFFRFINKTGDKEKVFNQAFSIVLSINIIFLIVTLISAQPIANWLGYPEHKNYVIWFAFVLVFDATSSLFLAKLRFENKAKRFAIVQLSSIGVNVVLNVFFIFVLLPIYPQFGIGFIFLANLFSSLIKPILLLDYIKQFKFIFDKALAKAMVIFATPLLIASFAGIINETFDRIMIKKLLLDKGKIYAQAQVGIYSANYKLSILITLFIQAFRYAAEPFFFAQEANKNKVKIYSKVMTYFVMTVSLMFLVISLNLDIFKWFIPNKAYWEGLKIVPILLLANVFLGIYYNQSIWYKLADKTRFGAYIAIIGAVITICLNYILIPKLGYLGAAWTTLTCYFIMMLLSHYYGQKHYPIKYNLRKVGFFLISAITLFFIGKFLTFNNFWLTFIVHNILVLIYIGFIFLIEKPLKEFGKK
jgi:O-antigen/teichoic acid export membrane protein